MEQQREPFPLNFKFPPPIVEQLRPICNREGLCTLPYCCRACLASAPDASQAYHAKSGYCDIKALTSLRTAAMLDSFSGSCSTRSISDTM